eukprot:scaffold103304_cov14-Tisochrysis_lutea.AAC.1
MHHATIMYHATSMQPACTMNHATIRDCKIKHPAHAAGLLTNWSLAVPSFCYIEYRKHPQKEIHVLSLLGCLGETRFWKQGLPHVPGLG